MIIRTKLRAGNLATIYAEERRQLKSKVEAGDVLLTKIKRRIIPLLILNAKGSWNLLVPKNVTQSMGLKEGEVLDIRILNHFSKRKNRHELKRALFVKNKKYFIDAYYAIPDMLKHRNEKFYIFHIDGDKVICWHKFASPMTIKRFIPLNELSLESFGLLQGELTKTGGNFLFGNTSSEIIKTILTFLELLGICKNSLSFSISYYKSYMNENIENRIKNYWSYICKVDLDKIRFYHIPQSFVDDSKSSKNGMLTIEIFSTVIAEIMWNLLNLVNSLIARNPNFACYYLRGAFEADGTVLRKKNDTISNINIACASAEEVSIYKGAFEILNIKTMSDSRNYIYVNRKSARELGSWNFLWKLIKIDIFKHNIDNKVKLIKGFLNFRATKIIIKYLKHFNRKSSWTARELRPHVLRYWDVNWVTKKLNDLVEVNLLKKVNSTYQITLEGKCLLNFVDKNLSVQTI